MGMSTASPVKDRIRKTSRKKPPTAKKFEICYFGLIDFRKIKKNIAWHRFQF